jgi:hypothetical protein
MTMELDALHAGEPMRNSLDPCNTCADWLALKADNDRLRAALQEAVHAINAYWNPYSRLTKRQAAALATMEQALRAGVVYACANAFSGTGRCGHWCGDMRACMPHPKPEHAHSSGVRSPTHASTNAGDPQ